MTPKSARRKPSGGQISLPTRDLPGKLPPSPTRTRTHTRAGGGAGLSTLQGPHPHPYPCGSPPLGDGFGSDCHITRCYIPPWGLGLRGGVSGKTIRFRRKKKARERADRSWRCSYLAPPSEIADAVSKQSFFLGVAWGRLPATPQGQHADTAVSSHFLGPPGLIWGCPRDPRTREIRAGED